MCRRPAQLVLKLGRGPAPLGEQLDHVCRDADRLCRIYQGALDGLLDPVAGIGAETGIHVRVEAFHGAQQPEVAFLDEVLQAKSFARVASSDIDDQAEIGAHHAVACFAVSRFNAVSELFLFVGAQERRFVDFAKVRLQRRLDRIAACPAES